MYVRARPRHSTCVTCPRHTCVRVRVRTAVSASECVSVWLDDIAACSFYCSDLRFLVWETARDCVHYSKAVRDQVIINKMHKFMFVAYSLPHVKLESNTVDPFSVQSPFFLSQFAVKLEDGAVTLTVFSLTLNCVSLWQSHNNSNKDPILCKIYFTNIFLTIIIIITIKCLLPINELSKTKKSPSIISIARLTFCKTKHFFWRL